MIGLSYSSRNRAVYPFRTSVGLLNEYLPAGDVTRDVSGNIVPGNIVFPCLSLCFVFGDPYCSPFFIALSLCDPMVTRSSLSLLSYCCCRFVSSIVLLLLLLVSLTEAGWFQAEPLNITKSLS
jgi:hypothetical protein